MSSRKWVSIYHPHFGTFSIYRSRFSTFSIYHPHFGTFPIYRSRFSTFSIYQAHFLPLFNMLVSLDVQFWAATQKRFSIYQSYCSHIIFSLLFAFQYTNHSPWLKLCVGAWEIETHVSVGARSPAPRPRKSEFQFTVRISAHFQFTFRRIFNLPITLPSYFKFIRWF